MSKIVRKRSIKFKWSVFILLMIFVIIILAFLWSFQIFFLESFYLNSKRSELVTSTEFTAQNIDDPDIKVKINELARDKSICLLVTDETGYILYSAEGASNCIVHKLSSIERIKLYHLALENGGKYLHSIKSTYESNNENSVDSLLYVEVLNTSTGNIRVIISNTNCTSIKDTKNTLLMQLIWLTIIIVILAIIIGLIISYLVTKPIQELNKKAKHLGKDGNDIIFEQKGYREIEELSHSLQYASSELSKVDALQKELIANISHDLRTPLTLLTGYAEIIRDIPGENTSENVQVIIDEANRMSELVNDLLDISKIQSGNIKLEFITFNITDCIINILQRYKKMSDYNISFKYHELVYVTGDKIKISQVIYNLINNAINYTGSDKIISICQRISENRVRISVIDTGEGIEDEKLNLIWDRYFKVDKNHKRAQVGSGLGLSIVKSILNLHPRASFGVNSTIGKGSEFWFELEISSIENI